MMRFATHNRGRLIGFLLKCYGHIVIFFTGNTMNGTVYLNRPSLYRTSTLETGGTIVAKQIFSLVYYR